MNDVVAAIPKHSRRKGSEMMQRLVPVAAMLATVVLTACSSGPARPASVGATTQPAVSTTTVLPTVRLDGTGTSLLMHSGANGFVLINGTIASPLLGSGKFHEDGIFGAESPNPSWTAKATFTAANGDTLKFRSVGGVQFYDADKNPHSATTETVTGGTGRFTGATGSWTTTGITTVRHVNATIDLQTYAFKFGGTITTTAARTQRQDEGR